MKFHYYPETDSLYIDLMDRPGASSVEVSKGVVLDFDENMQLVGIDIDEASKHVNITSVEVKELPVKNFTVAAS